FRGLIDDASGPDAVAGVLAHEMGHVTERHGTAGLIKALGLGFFFGVVLGDLGSGAVLAAGETLLQLSYGRDAERDADDRAVDLLTASGISSQGLADFFQQLERLEAGDVASDKSEAESEDAESPDRKSNQDHEHDHDDWGGFTLPPYLSTHPASAERRATIQAAVDRHAAAKRSDFFTPSMSKTAWESLLDICPPGEKGRAGR
ncbi:MAG: M48 family metallopeptidase, partial [Pseudomonadota bacterium]